MSENYLAHYGVKGMQWRNKKSPEELQEELQRYAKEQARKGSESNRKMREDLEAYAKKQTTPTKMSIEKKRKLKAALEAYARQQTQSKKTKPAVTTSSAPDPSNVSAGLASVQKDFSSGKLDPSEASAKLKALQEQLEAYAKQQTTMKHSDDFLMHHGIKGQKWGVRRWKYNRAQAKKKRERALKVEEDKQVAKLVKNLTDIKVNNKGQKVYHTIDGQMFVIEGKPGLTNAEKRALKVIKQQTTMKHSAFNSYYSDDIYDVDDFLEHHGVKGMKWGVRHDRKSSGGNRSSSSKSKKSKDGQSWFQRNKKKIAVTAVSVAAAGTAAALGYKYMKTYKPKEMKEIVRGVKKAGRDVSRGVKKAKRNVSRGAKKAGRDVSKGLKKAKRGFSKGSKKVSRNVVKAVIKTKAGRTATKAALKTYIKARHIPKYVKKSYKRIRSIPNRVKTRRAINKGKDWLKENKGRLLMAGLSIGRIALTLAT